MDNHYYDIGTNSLVPIHWYQFISTNAIDYHLPTWCATLHTHSLVARIYAASPRCASEYVLTGRHYVH